MYNYNVLTYPTCTWNWQPSLNILQIQKTSLGDCGFIVHRPSIFIEDKSIKYCEHFRAIRIFLCKKESGGIVQGFSFFVASIKKNTPNSNGRERQEDPFVRPHNSPLPTDSKFWLVVEPTHLKNISQIGNLPQVGWKWKMFQTTT